MPTRKRLKIILVILFIIVIASLTIFILKTQLLKKDVSNSENIIINQTLLDFDGVDDYVNFLDKDEYSPTGNLSGCIGFYNKGRDMRTYLISKTSSNNNEYSLSFEKDNSSYFTLFQPSGITHNSLSIGGKLEWNRWYYICFNNNNQTRLSLYIDGIFNATDTTYNNSVFVQNGVSNLTLGGKTGSYFNGSINAFLFSNKLLSPYRLAEEYLKYPQANNGDRVIPIIMLHNYSAIHPGNDPLIINLSVANTIFNFLSDSGFETITDEDLYNYSLGLKELPEKPIILIFDDGYSGLNDIAEIMRNYGYVGVVALITNKVGENGYLNWDDITSLVDYYGWSVASHSVNHSYWTTSNNDLDLLIWEMNESYNNILGNLSYNPIMYVSPGNKWNSTSMNICRQYYKICTGSYKSNLDYAINSIYVFKNTNLTDGSVWRIGFDNNTNIYNLNVQLNSSWNEEGIVIDAKLNENSYMIAYDSSGNGNNGIIIR